MTAGLKIRDLSLAELKHRLATTGIALRTGPLVSRVRSRFAGVADGLKAVYADYELGDPEQLCDFDCDITRPSGLRRWFKPQTVFGFDGLKPFTPLAANQAFAMMEWGLNWCVSNHCHQFIIIHAAVIARDGHAVVLPAPPGSGKSTLCAGLVCRGWRLLSDELCLIDARTGELVPLPRPVSLKNQSIEVIQRFQPDAVFSRVTHDTIKGSVAHMRAPRESVERAHERARFSWLILPKYSKGAALKAEAMTPGKALISIADNSFNYQLHGSAGFEQLANVIAGAQAMRFEYSELNEAVEFFAALKAPAP
jgi:HprK-related kinase A